MTMKPAAIDNDADYAADCARRAAQFHARADAATDLRDKERLRRVAYGLADDARFWGKRA